MWLLYANGSFILVCGWNLLRKVSSSTHRKGDSGFLNCFLRFLYPLISYLVFLEPLFVTRPCDETTTRKSISSWIHETLENEKAHFKTENRQKTPKMVIFRPFGTFSSKCLLQAPGSLPGPAAPAPPRRPDPGGGTRQGRHPGTPEPVRTPPGAPGPPPGPQKWQKTPGAPIDH